MQNIAKILCPVDFSEPSKAAFQAAVDLAEKVVRSATCPVLTMRYQKES